MIYPKLYAKSNRMARIVTKLCLEKYNHLIKWRSHPSIMEFGYADGGTSQESLSPYLPKDMKVFVAVDKSMEMVEYAKKVSAHPLMKFAKLDIVTEEVPSEYINRFDHVFAFFVMHQVKHPRQGFMNIHKMLKPGGSMFLTFFEHTPIDDTLDELLQDPKWNRYGMEHLISPYYYSPNPRLEWEKDLKLFGFQNSELFEENYSYEFLDRKEFEDLCLSVCIFLPNIPEEKLEEFKELYKKKTREAKLFKVQAQDGKEVVTCDFKLFIASASKT